MTCITCFFSTSEAGLSQYDPKPGLDSLKLRINSSASVVCVVACPGIQKHEYCIGLLSHYPTFLHICMGDLLRNRAKLEKERPESNWKDSVDVINTGDLLSSVSIF